MSMSTETIRLEEYTGQIQEKLVTVWLSSDTIVPWIPSAFLLSQYITRILVTGRTSAISTVLSADASWTQVWRLPGGKEWSCLFGIHPHMPGPVLLVIGPDIPLTTPLITSLKTICASTINPTHIVLYRQPTAAGWIGDLTEHIFFPVVDIADIKQKELVVILQEFVSKVNPNMTEFSSLLPQLAAQGYALTIANHSLHWYKPSESTPLTFLSIPQVAHQLRILATALGA
jgi:hypothetical protein